MALVTVTASPPTDLLRRELLSLLLCPEDHGTLVGWDSRADEGALTCETCGRRYPVRDSIPCLLPDGLREEHAFSETDTGELAEKHREMAARDAQVADYDRMLGLKLFSAAELPMTLNYLAPDADSLMLEGGCGTGRMTPMFAAHTRGLVAMDFSAESIRVARTKLTPEQREKTLFLQADLSRLPLRTEAFDRVGSFGVYEHIPTADARRRAMGEMARALKGRAEGGRFAFSAYRWGPPQSWMSQKEGHHPGGIYFYRFTGTEARADAALHFEVVRHTEALLYYHLIAGRRPAA
jgi:uncharacterized protein YbaR (Trm112 family)/ubiquinone/menaquinone biosynthesis C-methylase UbiE